MSYRDTEKQRDGDNDETEETEEVPPLAASVKTLQEAVQLSLKDGFNKDSLFIYARAIKAFEVTHNRRLPPAELQSAFALWWSTAQPLLAADADFDEFRFDFEDTFAKTHAPLGSDSLQEAIRRADAVPLPSQSDRYTSAKLKRLVAVCFHLQQLQGTSPFFLGLRAVQRITGTKNLYHARALMTGLIGDGLLVLIEPGNRKRSARYRFKLPDSAPATATGPDDTVAPVAAASMEPPKPRKVPRGADATKPLVKRAPTTYDLVERKKALQDLLKEIGHSNHWEAEDRKRHRALKKELAHVNALLAGVDSDAQYEQTSTPKSESQFEQMRRAVTGEN